MEIFSNKELFVFLTGFLKKSETVIATDSGVYISPLMGLKCVHSCIGSFFPCTISWRYPESQRKSFRQQCLQFLNLLKGHEISEITTPGVSSTWERGLGGTKMGKYVWYGAQGTFQVGRLNMEQACQFCLILAIGIAIFGYWRGAWKWA